VFLKNIKVYIILTIFKKYILYLLGLYCWFFVGSLVFLKSILFCFVISEEICSRIRVIIWVFRFVHIDYRLNPKPASSAANNITRIHRLEVCLRISSLLKSKGD